MTGLEVYLHDVFVGVIERAPRQRGSVRLSVDPAYRPDIVLSEAFTVIPGRTLVGAPVSNFLGGYVPEGNHRTRMAEKRGVDSRDLFALLREFGGSIAGAVSIRLPGATGPATGSLEILDDEKLSVLLTQALNDSDQAIADDSRSTLPGYQPKVLASFVDGRWSYPHGSEHSTFILKPQVPARPTRIFDEHFSHLLARRMGLSAYDSRIHTANGVQFLAIERFDRTVDGDGTVMLHHQEDLAQALGLNWMDSDVKFEDRHAPADPNRATVRAIGELLGQLPDGNTAVKAFIRQLTYNVAIGNNDAHAKNYALMHLSTGAELSPIYDALPNFFQDGRIEWNMALSIDKQFDHRTMSVNRILDEIASWGVISRADAESAIADTLSGFREALTESEAPDGISDGLLAQLHWNIRQLLDGHEVGERDR